MAAEIAASSTSRRSTTSTRCRADVVDGRAQLPGARAPASGPRVNEVKAALATADGSALQRRLETDGFIEVAGERLTADDVEVRAARHEAFALAEEGGWAVALDLELDDDLRREGLARELVRGLNDLRKEVGLDVADRIALTIEADDGRWRRVAAHRDYVMGEVLAVELTSARPAGPRASTSTATHGPVAIAGRHADGRAAGRTRQRRRPAATRSAPRPCRDRTPPCPTRSGGSGVGGSPSGRSSRPAPAGRRWRRAPAARRPPSAQLGRRPRAALRLRCRCLGEGHRLGGRAVGRGPAGGSWSDATWLPGRNGGRLGGAGRWPLVVGSDGRRSTGPAPVSSGAGRSTSASGMRRQRLERVGSSSRRCSSAMPPRMRCAARRIRRQHLEVGLERVAVDEQRRPRPRRRPGRPRRPAGLGLGLGRVRAASSRASLSTRLASSLASLMVASAVRWASTSVRRSVSSVSDDLGTRRRRPPAGPRRAAAAPRPAGPRRPRPGPALAHALVQVADARGDPLDEVVDVAGVVAPRRASRNSTAWSVCGVSSMREE